MMKRTILPALVLAGLIFSSCGGGYTAVLRSDPALAASSAEGISAASAAQPDETAPDADGSEAGAVTTPAG